MAPDMHLNKERNLELRQKGSSRWDGMKLKVIFLGPAAKDFGPVNKEEIGAKVKIEPIDGTRAQEQSNVSEDFSGKGKVQGSP